MPTYQYACTECGHAFEQFQSFSDDALTECPQCQGRLRKLFNAVGVVFKGSGFYRNDSRATASGGSGASSTSEGSSSGSGDGANGSSSSPAKEKAGSTKESAGSGSGSGSGSSTSAASGS